MAAELKTYNEVGCTTEIVGLTDIGTLNGTTGETVTKSIWVKNTGTVDQTGVTLTESLDAAARGSYSLDDSTYSQTTITLGDMDINDIVRIYVKVVVEAATAGEANTGLNFNIAGSYTA